MVWGISTPDLRYQLDSEWLCSKFCLMSTPSESSGPLGENASSRSRDGPGIWFSGGLVPESCMFNRTPDGSCAHGSLRSYWLVSLSSPYWFSKLHREASCQSDFPAQQISSLGAHYNNLERFLKMWMPGPVPEEVKNNSSSLIF